VRSGVEAGRVGLAVNDLKVEVALCPPEPTPWAEQIPQPHGSFGNDCGSVKCVRPSGWAAFLARRAYPTQAYFWETVIAVPLARDWSVVAS